MDRLYWCFLVVDDTSIGIDTYPTILNNENEEEEYRTAFDENKWKLVTNKPLPIWCSNEYTHSFVVLCDSEIMKDDMALLSDKLARKIIKVVKNFHGGSIAPNIFNDLYEVVEHIERHMDDDCCC